KLLYTQYPLTPERGGALCTAAGPAGGRLMVKEHDKCRQKLIEVAKARQTIYYSELARHLGMENQDPVIGNYLDTIYEDETRSGRPDLTLVVVYKKTRLVRFNYRGKPTRTVTVDEANLNHLASYVRE